MDWLSVEMVVPQSQAHRLVRPLGLHAEDHRGQGRRDSLLRHEAIGGEATMATPSYQIVVPAGRVLCTDLSSDEIASICDDLGYDRDHVLRRLRREHRVKLSDDVGEFFIVEQ
jgi:hypothetical protein